MRKLFVLMALPALVVAAQNPPPTPKQSVKVEIRILQDGKEPIVLPAKRPEMASRANMMTGEAFWRFLFQANQPEVPASPLAFLTTVDPNDLPGGGFFLCAMKKSGDKFYFNVSTDAAGSPKDDFVDIKPGDFESTKNADGSFNYRTTKPLKRGAYALYFSDNQYAWPFIVK
jgi:hypothetical protein